MRTLVGKTVWSIAETDFRLLFCLRCRRSGVCDKELPSISECRKAVDSGEWYKTYQTEG